MICTVQYSSVYSNRFNTEETLCFQDQLIGGGGGGGGASDPNEKLNPPFDASICAAVEPFCCIQGGQAGGIGRATIC